MVADAADACCCFLHHDREWIGSGHVRVGAELFLLMCYQASSTHMLLLAADAAANPFNAPPASMQQQ